METAEAIARALAGRGYAAARQVVREGIQVQERGTVLLPAEIVRPDGSLDLYPDVLNRFQPVFSQGRPAIQCGGWMGYIPLNDRFALEVSPRVPIGNLERIIGIAAGVDPEILKKYTRRFTH